jgi:hypothetical protein
MWEHAGRAVREAYVASQHKKATQPNLLPWTRLRADFKHSNRHQACCANILRRAGFVVERTAVGSIPTGASAPGKKTSIS